MKSSIDGLSSRKQQEWDWDLKQFGIKISQGEVISLEMSVFMPSYLFLVLEPGCTEECGGLQPKGKVAFYTRDDRPFAYDEDNKIHWYIILPDNLPYVRMKIGELLPSVEIREGQEGYVIPLQESPFFNRQGDVISYQRNLMFWESMLYDEGYGPFASRFAFLAHHVYRLRGEQRDAVIKLNDRGVRGIEVDEDNTLTIIDAMTKWCEEEIIASKRHQLWSKDRYEEERMRIERKNAEIRDLMALAERDRMEGEYMHTKMQQQLGVLQNMLAEAEQRNRETTMMYRMMMERINEELFRGSESRDDDK